MTLKQAVPIVLTLIIIGSCNSTTESKSGLKPIEELGKRLFFDVSLSDPPGQSCASCHSPETGFTGPDSEINSHGAVYAGAVNTRFGNRKPSSISYGGQSPILYSMRKRKNGQVGCSGMVGHMEENSTIRWPSRQAFLFLIRWSTTSPTKPWYTAW